MWHNVTMSVSINFLNNKDCLFIFLWVLIIVVLVIRISLFTEHIEKHKYRKGYSLNHVTKLGSVYKLEFQDLVLYKNSDFNIPYGSYIYVYFDSYKQLGNKKYVFHQFRYSYDQNFLSKVSEIRKRAISYIDNKYHDNSNTLVKGIVLGIDLPRELKNKITKVGINHLFVISGQHLFYLLIVSTFISNLIFKNLRIKTGFIIFSMFCFFSIIGLQFSLLRAVMMYSVFMFHKSNHFLTSFVKLFFVLCIILIIFPYAVFDLGLYFSFLAVLAIVYINSFKYENAFVKVLLINLAINVFLFPLTLYYFDVVNLNGVIASLVISSLIPFLYISIMFDLLLNVNFSDFVITLLLNLIEFFYKLPLRMVIEQNTLVIVIISMILIFLVIESLLYRHDKYDSE